jgi:hypothetical protein
MNQFERSLIILTGGLRSVENDPGFGYRVYRLPDDDNARFFRVPRSIATSTGNPSPPITGLFVSATMEPKKQQLCLAFCSFPKGSDGATYQTHAKLAYDVREITKGRQHIVDFLSVGRIPQADEEYSN